MFKNRNGSTLVIVMAFMAIMMIMGTTLLNLSLFETKLVSHENKRMQAYYYARAGAEALIAPFLDANVSEKPKSGQVNFVFQSGKLAVTTSPTTYSCKTTISTDASNTVKIVSTGKYLDEERTVTATLKRIIPKSMANTWYNEHSGQIIEGSHMSEYYSGAAVIELDPHQKLKYACPSSTEATFGADLIYFEPDYETPDHNKLTIVCETLVIKNNIEVFDAQYTLTGHATANTDIMLKLTNNKGFNIGTYDSASNKYYYNYTDGRARIEVSGKYGKLYRFNGTDYERYYFPIRNPDGLSLRYDADDLIPMDINDPNWDVPDYNSTAKIIWSE